MAKYRKKPVVIEAVQFDGTHEGGSAIIGWMKTYGTVGGAIGEAILSIATLEGTMTASPGDWIIKGVQGEFYPCKPKIFEATYEPEEGAALATAQPEAKPEGVDDAAHAALWRKHKDSFAVLQAMLEAASPLVLNKLKAQEAANAAMLSPTGEPT